MGPVSDRTPIDTQKLKIHEQTRWLWDKNAYKLLKTPINYLKCLIHDNSLINQLEQFLAFWDIITFWFTLKQLFIILNHFELSEHNRTYDPRSIWDLYSSTWAIQLYLETFIKHQWNMVWNMFENIWNTLEKDIKCPWNICLTAI